MTVFCAERRRSSCIYPRMAEQPMKESSLLTGALEQTNEAYALANLCVFLMNGCSGEETVNAGTGKELTIRELTELVAKVVGYRGRIEWDTTRPNGTPRRASFWT